MRILKNSEKIKKTNKICDLSNLKFTKNRKKAFELISESKYGAKAYDLLKKIDDKNSPPPVIYRALDFLLQQRLIHKIKTNNRYFVCAHPQEKHNCYFLVCKSCGALKECCNDNLDNKISKLAKENDFFLSNSVIEMEGLCNKCFIS